MRHQNDGQTTVFRRRHQEFAKRIQPPSRSADANDRNARLCVRRPLCVCGRRMTRVGLLFIRVTELDPQGLRFLRHPATFLNHNLILLMPSSQMLTDPQFQASHAERLVDSTRAKLACGAIHNPLRRRFNLPRGVNLCLTVFQTVGQTMELLKEEQVGKMARNDFAENDRAVERQLDACLREYFFFATQRVNLECHDGVVVLRGHVSTFHEKQMAQELARRVEGVRIVVNRLVVGANAISRIVNEAVLSAR